MNVQIVDVLEMTTTMIAKTNSYMPESKSDTHITPDRVFELIKDKWNYKYDEFYDPCPVNGTEGLTTPWEKLNFVNPPYTLLKQFVWNAMGETNNGNVTIMLLPARVQPSRVQRSNWLP